MENIDIAEIIKFFDDKGFTLIEFKQEQNDGNPCLVMDNGRGSTGVQSPFV
jgi:hypothetical protein